MTENIQNQRIIAVCGLPASGKSYFAFKLAKRIQASFISSDMIRKEMFASRQYTQIEKMKVYDRMITEMEMFIMEKKSVVLDGTFYRKSIRDRFIKANENFGLKIIFIYVQAAEEIIKLRLAKKRKYSEADYSVYLKIKAEFEPLKGDFLVLDSTNENIRIMLDNALKYIDKIHD